MTTKKVTFTLAIYKIAGVKVTLYSINYIYEQDQSQPKIANQFADSFYTGSLHLGILFQIYGWERFLCTKNRRERSADYVSKNV